MTSVLVWNPIFRYDITVDRDLDLVLRRRAPFESLASPFDKFFQVRVFWLFKKKKFLEAEALVGSRIKKLFKYQTLLWMAWAFEKSDPRFEVITGMAQKLF